LVAIDRNDLIRIVNPAFCRMFRTSPDQAVGLSASILLGDLSEFHQAWDTGAVCSINKEYPEFGFSARERVFAIKSEGIAACVMVDMTEEARRSQQYDQLQNETIAKVNEVVDNQMKVAQEIASLLGETTAETKASLLKLVSMIERKGEPGGQLS
jgi:hypothetical protein